MSTSSSEEEEVEVILEVEEQSSGEDPPMSEWSSLELEVGKDNIKKVLYSQGLYSPGSGELCTKYIAQSDSDVFRHLYYNYPAVHDPGIKEAILSPEKPLIHADDGQTLYLALCKEMNICPVGLFHRNLLNNDINLSYYGVNPQGVRAMAMALQYNKYVKTFNLKDNHLSSDACYHLGQMLRSNVTLKELNLSGCRIGATGLLYLGQTIHVNKSLNVLDISKNSIGENGGIHFAKMIFNGISVKHVNLSYNQLGRQSALAIGEAFEYKDKITHLDLSWNNFFHAPSCVRLLDQMSQSSVLQVVNLAWNGLEGERIAETIKYMLTIPTLTVLDLSNNRFLGEAIEIIVSNLIKAKKLITLNLSFNPMTPNDAFIALQKMLRPRVKLANLLMANIWVNKTFMELLMRVKRMKSRKDFVVTFGGVYENWTITGADPRELIFRRADYLGNLSKKNKVDVALFFLALTKERPKPARIPFKDLIDICDTEHIPLDEGIIAELAVIFPGPKSKIKTIDLDTLCEFLQRIWPERKLPVTPPPEPEPEPIPEPVPEPGKGKKKGKK